jgi:hypothetical protein
MHQDLFIHVIHVSGKCMQSQCTDGLSRGLLDGTEMLQFVPLHLSDAEREPAVTACVNSWCLDVLFPWLTPFGWFNQGHQLGRYIWCPLPAAANACFKITVTIHKHPLTQHIVTIAQLMTVT